MTYRLVVSFEEGGPINRVSYEDIRNALIVGSNYADDKKIEGTIDEIMFSLWRVLTK